MWDPTQYQRFAAERRQPFLDLLAFVEPRPDMRVADLGCGSGDLTGELHHRLQAVETVGIDSSEAMLLDAAAFAEEGLRFAKGEIETFVAEQPFDLLFSNAALHWVADHETLLPRLAALLGHNGQLAIQVPANDDHASHATAAEVAIEMGFEPRAHSVLPIERYAIVLHRIGFRRQHVRMQVYGHELASTSEVVEWVKGTLMTDYERRLGERFEEFLQAYRARLLAKLGDQRPYYYTYKRILMWAGF